MARADKILLSTPERKKKKKMACSVISRTVVPSSRCIGSASGFFLHGDDGSSCPDTVLALSDALELLGSRNSRGKGGDIDDDDEDAITTSASSSSAPSVLFRRRVHGVVRAVATLPVKVCALRAEGELECLRERGVDAAPETSVDASFRCLSPRLASLFFVGAVSLLSTPTPLPQNENENRKQGSTRDLLLLLTDSGRVTVLTVSETQG